MNEKAQHTAIAQALGWTLHDPDESGYTCKRCGTHYSRDLWRAWEVPFQWCPRDGQRYPPDLNEINAAMELVDFLRKNGWLCEMKNYPTANWKCSFYLSDLKREASAETLALAICEAGLRALGLWKEEE